MTPPLRVCRVCGLEAHTEKDLELFLVGTHGSKYGRDTICRDCHNKRCMEKKYSKKWREDMKNGLKEGYTHINHTSNGTRVFVVKDGKCLFRSRAVMEEHLGRRLESNEIVHHINGDTLDDRLENLKLMTNSDHIGMHHWKGDDVCYMVLKYQRPKRKDYTKMVKENIKPKNTKEMIQ